MSRFLSKHPWFAKLALLVTSAALGFALMDGIVRAAGFDSPLLWEPHPSFGWWHIPGVQQHWTEEGDGWVEINSHRLRDPERTVAKPERVFRIAVFGDSMTEGVQVNVDQTFTQQLEKHLTQRIGRKVEVLNFGVNGYSPLQEYLLYKDYGRQFSPDLVLHALFLDNDVADLHPKLASGQRGGPFVAITAQSPLRVDHTAAEQSYRDYRQQPVATVRRISSLYRILSAARYARIQSDTFQAAKIAGQGIPRRYLLYSTTASPIWEEAWRSLESVVAEFAREVRRDGARYALVSVPAGQVVNAEAWDNLRNRFPAMQNARWDLRHPEARLSELAARRHIPLISGVETFASSPQRKTLFFGLVGHFTPRGHGVMAHIIEQAVFAQALITSE